MCRCVMLTLAVVLLNCVSATAAEGKRPNVLLIMADDCTYNDLPIYGGANAKTPHLDRLASQGLVFNRANLAEAMQMPNASANTISTSEASSSIGSRA